MKRLITEAIVLSRTNYGEADRIVTMLTPEQGKLRLMARGVRKPKSKLAGGIELFSTSQITYMPGHGEIGTLISTRLIKYYSTIVQDIERVQLGYELIKMLNKATEDQPEPGYYYLMEESFKALDTKPISTELIKIWFQAQLLRLAGHSPNLETDTESHKLIPGQNYDFDYEQMAFTAKPNSSFSTNHIKTLRLLISGYTPVKISKVRGIEEAITLIEPMIRTMATTHLQV